MPLPPTCLFGCPGHDLLTLLRSGSFATGHGRSEEAVSRAAKATGKSKGREAPGSKQALARCLHLFLEGDSSSGDLCAGLMSVDSILCNWLRWHWSAGQACLERLV